VAESTIIFPPAVTVAGATQFDPAAATFNFLDTFTSLPANSIVRLKFLSYNSIGTAHNILVTLSPAVGAAGNLQVVLRDETGINNFTDTCDRPVPRASATIPFVILVTTTGKDDAGTLRVGYTIESP
jgi:hypothetical protein